MLQLACLRGPTGPGLEPLDPAALGDRGSPDQRRHVAGTLKHTQQGGPRGLLDGAAMQRACFLSFFRKKRPKVPVEGPVSAEPV